MLLKSCEAVPPKGSQPSSAQRAVQCRSLSPAGPHAPGLRVQLCTHHRSESYPLTALSCRSACTWTHAKLALSQSGPRELFVQVGARPLQDRMHLDCVFSILGDRCCLMLEEMIGEESKTARYVDEYTRDAFGEHPFWTALRTPSFMVSSEVGTALRRHCLKEA